MLRSAKGCGKVAVLGVLALAVVPGRAEETRPATASGPAIRFVEGLGVGEQDRVVLERFIGHAVKYAEGLTEEKIRAKCLESPEMFAWVEFRYLNCLNVAYELTHDVKYLDLFEDRFALFRKIMTTGPDKYLGWYGKPIPPRRLKDKPDLQIDELQMNFRAISLLAGWVEQARTQPEYAKKHAETIEAYVDLMEKHLFPKWDARGHFVEIPGRGGVYRGLDYPHPSQVTLSHEKLSIMVDGLLKLHRVTGKDAYLQRALQIGTWFKSNLSVKDGHYEWMSWAPAGKWDVSPDKPDAWVPGWIAPDPNGPWYVTSVSIAMNLYQHGLLFTDADLARFVKTQKTMCWNGDMEKPEYRTVAGATGKWVKGQFLSHQVAQYDADLRKLAFAGPHEAEVLKGSENSWGGGANAQEYVREKFLMGPRVAKNPRPYSAVGEQYLAAPANRKFYDGVFFEVKESGAVTPLKPSEMFGEK